MSIGYADYSRVQGVGSLYWPGFGKKKMGA